LTNAQRLYNQTCRHLQAVQANIDRLAELNANEELALLTGRLQRLAFRAAPRRKKNAPSLTLNTE
jgi:type II secretory pathway component PulJ